MKFDTDKIMVGGHKGDASKVSENTLLSFETAIKEGVDIIETDIHKTKDGVLVLMHDNTIETTTDGKGLITQMTYDELKKVKVGKEKLPIPRLEELIELASKSGIYLNLEFKPDYYNDEDDKNLEETVDKTIELLKKYNMLEKTVCNTFDAHIFEYIYKKYGKIVRFQGYYPPDRRVRRMTMDPMEYLDYVFPDRKSDETFEEHRDEYIEYILSKNLEISIATNSTQDEVQEKNFIKYVKMGATMFIEDNPMPCLKAREKLNK